MLKRVLFLLVLPLIAFCQLTLVENGIPKSEIIIGEHPTRSAQFAAFELQHGVKLITGAVLPIVEKVEKADAVHIMVGLPADGETFKHEEYSIRFKGNAIHLAGNDNPDYEKVDYSKTNTFPPLEYYYRATCFAVYDFLEKACGMRFYSYGDVGTVFTPRKTLTVSPFESRREPEMKAFRVPYFEGPKDHVSARDLLLLRHRWRENTVYGYVNHNIYSIYYRYWGKAKSKELANVFIEHRPEYFAKREEGRRSSHIASSQYGGEYVPSQLCYAAEGPIDYFADEANKVYHGERVPGARFGNIKKLPDTPFFYPIQPDDDMAVCQCPKCSEMMEKDRISYHFNWVNKLAAKAHELNPDINIATLSYGVARRRPENIELYPNLSIQLCMSLQLWFHPLIYKRQHDTYKDWVTHEGKKRMLTCWLYLLCPSADFIRMSGKPGYFPVLYPKNTGKIITEYLDDGLQGLFAEIFTKQHELESYIMTRLIYDRSVGYEELLDEYYKLYYGNAGKAMKQVMETIEEISTNPKNYPESFLTKDNVNGSYMGGMYNEIITWHVGTPEHIAAIDKLIALAQADAQTPVEKERVKRFISNIWGQVKPGRAAFERHQELRSFKIPSIDFVAPAAEYNGDLDKADFRYALTFNDWKSAYGDAVTAPATLKLFTDSTHLYVDYAEKGSEPYAKRDQEFWRNGLEIFLGLDKSLNFKQMFTTVNGYCEFYDNAIIEGVAHFDKQKVDIKTKNELTEEGWHLQLAIPLSVLGKQLQTQKSFCANFIRTKLFTPASQNNSFYFSPIFTASHQAGIDRMGDFFLPAQVPQDRQILDTTSFTSKTNELPTGWAYNPRFKLNSAVKDGHFIITGQDKVGYINVKDYTPIRPGDTVEYQFTAAGKNAACAIFLSNGPGRHFVGTREQRFNLTETPSTHTVTIKVPETGINKWQPTHVRIGFRVNGDGFLDVSTLKVNVK